jgi:hypothetical protein
VPPDVAAGGAGRGDGDAAFDGDQVGIGFHRDPGGLACVRQADLDGDESYASRRSPPLPRR